MIDHNQVEAFGRSKAVTSQFVLIFDLLLCFQTSHRLLLTLVRISAFYQLLYARSSYLPQKRDHSNNRSITEDSNGNINLQITVLALGTAIYIPY